MLSFFLFLLVFPTSSSFHFVYIVVWISENTTLPVENWIRYSVLFHLKNIEKGAQHNVYTEKQNSILLVLVDNKTSEALNWKKDLCFLYPHRYFSIESLSCGMECNFLYMEVKQKIRVFPVRLTKRQFMHTASYMRLDYTFERIVYSLYSIYVGTSLCGKVYSA